MTGDGGTFVPQVTSVPRTDVTWRSVGSVILFDKLRGCRLRQITSTLVLVLMSVLLADAGTLTPAQAGGHIGERATVCGLVVSSHFAARSRGNPTFLNLERPYPNQVFTVLIWGSDRGKFGAPEVEFQSRRICVTGVIQGYRGVPEIVATQPEQITVQK